MITILVTVEEVAVLLEDGLVGVFLVPIAAGRAFELLV